MMQKYGRCNRPTFYQMRNAYASVELKKMKRQNEANVNRKKNALFTLLNKFVPHVLAGQ